jgi:glycosyltransferase involved in cell wall biosynthesis
MMKVSVSIITYNHEKFIRQTLDSVLMQDANFEYEIVIGEDCSTDNTRNILLEYQNLYPGKIRLLLSGKNQGLVRNFMQTCRSCEGEYVAMLDGDDYWTSSQKLQKQVDFLDQHMDYSICFHPLTMVFENSDKTGSVFPQLDRETYTLEDILYSNFIPSSSVMFRNGVFGEFPDWYQTFKIMEDWPIYTLIAQHGKIGFLKEVMGVYRLHSRSTWSLQDEIVTCQEEIKLYNYLEENLSHKYNNIIVSMLDKRFFKLAELYEDRYEYDSAKKYINKCVFINPILSRVKFISKMKMMLRLYCPELYRFVKKNILYQ